jgi:hypothetical protein
MAGFTAALALCLPARADEAPKAEVREGKAAYDFLAGGELVTRYHVGAKQSKPWFWPVNPLPGKTVTRSYPIEEGGDEKKDHVHHRSLWFCHGDVIPEGMEYVRSSDKKVKGVDFWSETPNHGRIVFRSGKVHGTTLATVNDWNEPGGKTVLTEKRDITLVPLGKGKNLLILDITLTAGEHPITFGDTKEGALGTRVRKTIALETSGGKGEMTNDRGDSGEKALWSKVAKWCDYSGPLGPDGPVGGITLMACPKNAIDTAWHARGYGLMAANPFARAKSFPGRKGQTELVRLGKGESLRLRFGVYLHAGNVKDGEVAEAYEAFSKRK